MAEKESSIKKVFGIMEGMIHVHYSATLIPETGIKVL